MKPKYKNELFKALMNNPLGLASFKLEDGLHEDGFDLSKITFIENGEDTAFNFLIRQHQEAFDQFDCSYIQYAPNMPYSGYRPYNSWTYITKICDDYLQIWLRDIQSYLEDKSTIDLWEEYAKTSQFQQTRTIDFEDKNDFSYDEKQQILLALQCLQINISQHFQIDEKQQKLISDGIKYLSDGVDRLNKVDWKSILIGQFFTIATAIASNPHQFDALYNMFLKVIQIVHVLPAH